MAVMNLLTHSKFLHDIDFLSEENNSLLQDRVIADIYCGTGIMGFEAYSRGAQKLLMVDKNGLTLDTAKKTAAKLGIIDDCYFIRSDATRLATPPQKADVIFLDPPYDRALVAPTLKSLADNMWPRNGGVIVVEHSVKEEFDIEKPYKLLDKRKYNNSYITILKAEY
jgi:16S rRNA (guanine966-N2)-methyltransferase